MLPDLDDLLSWRGSAARGIDWRTNPRPGIHGSGSQRAKLPIAVGRGLQYAESRPYQRGDDVRSLDWKVTARQGRPHTKVFEAERERPLWLVVDQGPSMQFGSRASFKSVLAARAAAWLAWSASAGGDRVGGVNIAAGGLRMLPARPGQAGVLGLLGALCDPGAPAGAAAGLDEALLALRALIRTGDRVAVISDFYCLDAPPAAARLELGLGELAGRGDVLLIQVSDPLENEPPPAGFYPLQRAGLGGWLDLADPATRQAWSAPYSRRRENLRTLAQRHACPQLALSTDGEILRELASLAGGR